MEYVWETGRLNVPAGFENEKSRVKKMINFFLTHPQSQIHVKRLKAASKQLLKVI